MTNFPQQIIWDIEIYSKKFGNLYKYFTSYQVTRNSENNPFKYICKYFDLPVGDDLYAFLEQKTITSSMIDDAENLRQNILNKIDKYIREQGATEYNFDMVINKIFIINPRYVNKGLEFTNRRKINPRVVFNRPITENDLSDIYSFDAGHNNITNVYLNNDNIKKFKEYIQNQKFSFSGSKNERGKMTPQLRAQVLARDNYTCQKCGASIYQEPNLLLEVDHIIPISKGGKTIIDNLQTLCWKCNRGKATS